MGGESLLFGFQFLIFWRGWTDNLTRNDSAKISFENLWIRAGEDGNGNGIWGTEWKDSLVFLNLMMRCRRFC